MIKDINDGRNNALELVKLLKNSFDSHVDYNVNLIPINVVKENNYKRPSNDDIIEFINVLDAHNIITTIRRELGKDISGSCGQLRASELI